MRGHAERSALNSCPAHAVEEVQAEKSYRQGVKSPPLLSLYYYASLKLSDVLRQSADLWFGDMTTTHTPEQHLYRGAADHARDISQTYTCKLPHQWLEITEIVLIEIPDTITKTLCQTGTKLRDTNWYGWSKPPRPTP